MYGGVQQIKRQLKGLDISTEKVFQNSCSYFLTCLNIPCYFFFFFSFFFFFFFGGKFISNILKHAL